MNYFQSTADAPITLGRAYFTSPLRELARRSVHEVIGLMAAQLPFPLEAGQREAWRYEIELLASIADQLPPCDVFFEFVIPRMGRRTDVILACRGIIFVLEFKVGSTTFDRHAVDQVYGYALDLKHFHETSHPLPIIPVLVATGASARPTLLTWSDDGVAEPVLIGSDGLASLLNSVLDRRDVSTFSATDWANGRYKPTPTIIEAAQALYGGHDVREISRSEAGAENLTLTAACIDEIIDNAKVQRRKVICFVTGVPGSGKTLAGLNIANRRMHSAEEEHAVFLSGNGPLVEVLRAALTNDAMHQARARGQRPSRPEEERKAAAFIQNIHHFRDEALRSSEAPVGKVVIFDEAQRAWDMQQTSRFMRDKRGQLGFAMSEPEFLLSVMDRHEDWCAVVCLIGGGQEINIGEAGLEEWLSALNRSFPHWDAYGSPRTVRDTGRIHQKDGLHLATSIRSFRAERLSDFVAALIDGDSSRARELKGSLADFPIVLTRSLRSARSWLREHRRATERAGLLASSNALRLKPEGIFVKAKADPPLWFLAEAGDVRSSDALEDVATEFEVQGLELDWTCVAWDANFRRSAGEWLAMSFRGSSWQRVNDDAKKRYVANSYRVLLTRARQGMIIYVPEGDDHDHTRSPAWYDAIAAFLIDCGLEEL